MVRQADMEKQPSHFEQLKSHLHRAGELYQGHFRRLIPTAALSLLPVGLLQASFHAFTLSTLEKTVTDDPGVAGLLHGMGTLVSGVAVQFFFLLPLSIFATFLAQSALLIQIKAAHFGRAIPTLQEAWREVFSRLIPLSLSSAIVLTGVAVGSVFFLVPGLLVLYASVFVPQVVALERKQGWEAIQRSFQLAKGANQVTALAFLTVMLFSWVIDFGCDLIFPTLASPFAGALLDVVLLPLPLTLITLLYLEVAQEVSSPAPGTNVS